MSPEYFPTTVGARWVVRVTADKRVSEHTEVVVKVEEKDGVKLVSVARDGGRPVSRYAVSPTGVSRVRQGESAFDPPLRLLRLPARPGNEWESDSAATSPFPPARYTGRCRAFGPEWVEVPAGRYQAVRVETEYTDGTRTFRRSAGSPGVGLLKAVSRSPGHVSETVLKSFDAGKD